MKTFKQTLFTIIAVVGLSFAVSAQKGGNGPPPKGNPSPKIVPKPKDPPKGGEKPKRPGMSFLIAGGKEEFSVLRNETKSRQSMLRAAFACSNGAVYKI